MYSYNEYMQQQNSDCQDLMDTNTNSWKNIHLYCFLLLIVLRLYKYLYKHFKKSNKRLRNLNQLIDLIPLTNFLIYSWKIFDSIGLEMRCSPKTFKL